MENPSLPEMIKLRAVTFANGLSKFIIQTVTTINIYP